MKPLVYLAGPITKPNPMANTNEAIHTATGLLHDGLCVPFVPQLSILWDTVLPLPYEDWLAYDFDVIRHCHALLRIPGESAGADREIVHAREIGVPVFFNTMAGRADFDDWARAWIADHTRAVSI